MTAYSSKDDQAQRLAAEDDLLADRVKALVATSALGMGFDKPDLGFVVHLGAPQSPVAYYQQDAAAPGAASSGPTWYCCPAGKTVTSGRTSPRSPSRREGQVRATLETLSRGGPRRCPPPRSRPTSTCPAGGLSRNIEGARRGRRGDQDRRRLGRPPAGRGPTTGTATSGWPEKLKDAEQQAMLELTLATRRVPGWSSCGTSWTTPRRPRAGGATTAPGSPWPADVPGGGGAGRAQRRSAHPAGRVG